MSPAGDVWPCVFSRWMPVGNVRTESLADIITGPVMRAAQAELQRGFGVRLAQKCGPETQCKPAKDEECQPNCPPGYHADPAKCWPYYYEE